MFCPRCGQQQATDSMRFCSRCGFAMEGTMHVLAHGGMLPVYQGPAGEKTISARRRGVKQGALLMLIGVLLVPILAIMADSLTMSDSVAITDDKQDPFSDSMFLNDGTKLVMDCQVQVGDVI